MAIATPTVIGHDIFLLPQHWACALVNADETGMSDEEITEMNEWLSDHPELGLCVDVSGEGEFAWTHDAIEYALACECATFTFEVIEQE